MEVISLYMKIFGTVFSSLYHDCIQGMFDLAHFIFPNAALLLKDHTEKDQLMSIHTEV